MSIKPNFAKILDPQGWNEYAATFRYIGGLFRII